MHFPVFNRTLLQGMMASAVVLAGATACSRSDRNDTAGDNSAAVLPDTTGGDATTPAGTGTTATGTATDTGTTTGALGDTASATAPSNATRARTAPAGSDRDSLQSGNKEAEAAGYREMGRDTPTTPSEPDSARVTADTSETSLNTGDSASVETAGAAPAVDSTNAADTSAAELAVTPDTAAAGYAEMARDTATGTPEQADTAWQAEGDVAEADTAAIHARVDTTPEVPTEVAIETSPEEDTISIKADSLAQHHEADRVRPPEDSTEILGNVTGNENADEADIEASTDEVGAAAIAGNVTGVDAVALMTRQGEQCIVVDPEFNETVRWDMSSTPATLNPCGMGSMNLSKIWTAKEE